jgi:site-specific DNA-adenine methylase
MKKLRLPFTYFGGKSAISDVIWKHLGDPKCYIEPFLGSGAALLNRPAFNGNRIEVVNDNYGMLVNFWRAMKHDAVAVHSGMEFPSSHDEIMARAYWCFTEGKRRIAGVIGDPQAFDLQSAQYWGYIMRHGVSRPIRAENGSWKWGGADGWLRAGHETGTDKIAISTPYMEGGRVNTPPLEDFIAIQNRLLNTVIYNRNAVDVLRGYEGVISRGKTGIFLDPPYRNLHHTWDDGIYHDEGNTESVIAPMLEWVLKHERHPNVKIVLAGYANDYPELAHWKPVIWDKHPGFSKHGESSQECLLLSPCAAEDESIFF